MTRAISLTPRGVALFFAAIVVALLGMHVVMQIAVAVSDADLRGLANMLDVGREKNVPTFYSSFALLFSAFLAAAVGLADRERDGKRSLCWLGLAVGFVFLATDEFIEIHERLIEPVRSTLNTSGALFYAWVIPYGLALIPLLFVGIWFLKRLPRRTAMLLALAGATFVTGGMFVEMLSGWALETYSEGVYAARGPLYIVLQTCEELLEMSGVVIFIYAVMDYASRHMGGVPIVLGARDVVATISVPSDGKRIPASPSTISVPEAVRAAEMLLEKSEEESQAKEKDRRR